VRAAAGPTSAALPVQPVPIARDYFQRPAGFLRRGPHRVAVSVKSPLPKQCHALPHSRVLQVKVILGGPPLRNSSAYAVEGGSPRLRGACRNAGLVSINEKLPASGSAGPQYLSHMIFSAGTQVPRRYARFISKKRYEKHVRPSGRRSSGLSQSLEVSLHLIATSSLLTLRHFSAEIDKRNCSVAAEFSDFAATQHLDRGAILASTTAKKFQRSTLRAAVLRKGIPHDDYASFPSRSRSSQRPQPGYSRLAARARKGKRPGRLLSGLSPYR
jgi:hypothetical protein